MAGDDQVETLFMRELRRRGMSSKERDGAAAGTDTKTKEESEGGGSFFGGWARTKPSPPLTESQRDEQLKRSMALNSEGLDVRMCASSPAPFQSHLLATL